MKNYTLLEALKEIAFLFPFQSFGKIENIESIKYNSSHYSFDIGLFNGESYFIDLDSQSYKKVEWFK